MEISAKAQKMIDIIKKSDALFRNNNDLYKFYFAPNIPEKVIKRLIKFFDSHLPANSIVAYYDSTLLSNCKGGFIFTTDGFYYKYIGKAIYFHYSDIKDIYLSNDNLELELNCEDLPKCTIISVLDMSTLKNILSDLISIDSEYGQSSVRSTGKIKKLDLPPDKMKKCKLIIHGASASCGAVGTGLAQIPASDNAVIVPIQITMIISLGAVFDLHITESGAKSILASAAASIVGRTVSQILWGWIPVIGNAINTATAAGITEVIGWIAVDNFYNRWIEDKNKGRFDGMMDGYNEASAVYEKKLRIQAFEFLNQMKNVEREHNEYEHLIHEYEEYIRDLEKKCAALDKINEIKEVYESLRNLESA